MATLYWYGGSGNWSDYTNHWSNNSGNAPASPASAAPTATDDVVFDTASNATDYTVTIDATATCRDLTMGAPASGKVTWAGSAALTISGSLNLSGGTAGITKTYTGGITFSATSGTKTLNFNGVASLSSIIFNGAGGTFQLASNLIVSKNGGSLILTNGSFDANGKSVTFNGGSANINNSISTGIFTFYDLIFTGTAVKTNTLTAYTNFAVSHTLTMNGNSSTNRTLVASSVIGTPRTIDITGTTGNSFSNVDFKDITIVTGGADLDLSAITGGSGNCGGNTGITFTTPVTTNWQSGATWSTATWSSRVPLPQDTATFTTAGVATITQDMPRIGSVDFTGSADKTWTTSTACSCFGSINLTNLATLTAGGQAYTFEGRGNYTLTTAGKTWTSNFNLVAPLGTLTLNTGTNDFQPSQFGVGSGGTTYVTTLDARTYNPNISTLNYTISGGGTVNMGSGVWTSTLASTGNIWSCATTASVNADTSTIKATGVGSATRTFAGGDKTYYKVWFSGGNSTTQITITGANTFNELKDDGRGSHTIVFPNSTTTATTWNINGFSGKVITLARTGASGTFTLNDTSGLNVFRNISVSNSSVDGGTSVFNAVNSTDGGNNTGWVFSTREISGARTDTTARSAASGRTTVTTRTAV